MTRLSVFDSPLLLGFDRVERMLDRIAKASDDGYPPYNIEQTGEQGLRITLAVAGFSMDELSVTVEDNQLVVRGKQVDHEDGRVYLHRGIAARRFVKTFLLAEGVEAVDATLAGGLLHVDLERPAPETRRRTIRIKQDARDRDPERIVEGRAERA